MTLYQVDLCYEIITDTASDLDCCCEGHKIEKNEIGAECSVYGDGRGVYRILVGKPEGKRQLGRSRRRWETNVKMDLQEVGCGGNKPSGTIKCGQFLDKLQTG
jgi:hypothetical protein